VNARIEIKVEPTVQDLVEENRNPLGPEWANFLSKQLVRRYVTERKSGPAVYEMPLPGDQVLFARVERSRGNTFEVYFFLSPSSSW
jgi:hypothetical protein